ncbi:MAG: ribosome small subunit-dependent GTPase A [Planctomycetota bacterium]
MPGGPPSPRSLPPWSTDAARLLDRLGRPRAPRASDRPNAPRCPRSGRTEAERRHDDADHEDRRRCLRPRLSHGVPRERDGVRGRAGGEPLPPPRARTDDRCATRRARFGRSSATVHPRREERVRRSDPLRRGVRVPTSSTAEARRGSRPRRTGPALPEGRQEEQVARRAQTTAEGIARSEGRARARHERPAQVLRARRGRDRRRRPRDGGVHGFAAERAACDARGGGAQRSDVGAGRRDDERTRRRRRTGTRAGAPPGRRRRGGSLDEELASTQRTSVAVGDSAFLRELARRLARRRDRRAAERPLAPDPGRPDLERVVAANVDAAIVVASVRQPAFRPGILDRYLVALERGGIAPIVCASKADLLVDEADRTEKLEVLRDLRSFGAAALLVSADGGEGLDELRELVRGRTVVLVGQSGVGKSSLANALFPRLAAATGRVREGDGKGRHTTTRSELFEVDDVGTKLIDTPGVRAFGLADVTRADLAAYFKDFEPFVADCRFSDCRHVHEPDCGVRTAAESGELARRRFDAYLRILASLPE